MQIKKLALKEYSIWEGIDKDGLLPGYNNICKENARNRHFEILTS